MGIRRFKDLFPVKELEGNRVKIDEVLDRDLVIKDFDIRDWDIITSVS